MHFVFTLLSFLGLALISRAEISPADIAAFKTAQAALNASAVFQKVQAQHHSLKTAGDTLKADTNFRQFQATTIKPLMAQLKSLVKQNNISRDIMEGIKNGSRTATGNTEVDALLTQINQQNQALASKTSAFATLQSAKKTLPADKAALEADLAFQAYEALEKKLLGPDHDAIMAAMTAYRANRTDANKDTLDQAFEKLKADSETLGITDHHHHMHGPPPPGGPDQPPAKDPGAKLTSEPSAATSADISFTQNLLILLSCALIFA